jgi:hypothetical protein
LQIAGSGLKCHLARQFREAEEPLRLRTAAEMMAGDSTYTREVAQHYADQINASLMSMRRLNSIRERYPDVGTVEAFDSLPAVEVVASQLAALKQYSRDLGADVNLRARIVGAVEEPPTWLNVLFRLEYEYEDPDPTGEIGFFWPQPRMLRLRRSPDGWRVANWWGLMNSGGFMGPGVFAASASRCM